MVLKSNGILISQEPDKLGELTDSNDILNDEFALRQRIKDDGYLHIKQFFDPELVLDARREILLKYAIIGEIDSVSHPLMSAVYSPDQSSVDKVNLIAFDESVRTGKAYLDLVQGDRIQSFFRHFFDVPEVCTFDFKWVRFLRPGEGCGFHCDSVYVCRGTYTIFSCWIPIGDVSKEEGALI